MPASPRNCTKANLGHESFEKSMQVHLALHNCLKLLAVKSKFLDMRPAGTLTWPVIELLFYNSWMKCFPTKCSWLLDVDFGAVCKAINATTDER